MKRLTLVVETEKGVENALIEHGADISDLHPVAVVEGGLCDGTHCFWCRKLRERINSERKY